MPYAMYNEAFASFLYKNNFPLKRKTNQSIYDFLKDYFEMFVVEFKLMCLKNENQDYLGKDFYTDLVDLLPYIKEVIDKILKTIELYDRGSLDEAHTGFFELMDGIVRKHKLFAEKIGTHNSNFYRIRASEEQVKNLDRKDVFHIPFTKRKLITNERFSIAGYPCLYLCSEQSLCWFEVGCPNHYYISEFRFDTESEKDWLFLKLYDPICFANEILLTQGDNISKMSIEYSVILLIVAACSVTNLDGDAVFKQDYIIPQILMLWVRRNILLNNNSICGIVYDTCSEIIDSRKWNAWNLVIPAMQINEEGYCDQLTTAFYVSEPRFINIKNYIPEDAKEISDNLYDELSRLHNTVMQVSENHLEYIPKTLDGEALKKAQEAKSNINRQFAFLKDVMECCRYFNELAGKIDSIDGRLTYESIRFLQSVVDRHFKNQHATYKGVLENLPDFLRIYHDDLVKNDKKIDEFKEIVLKVWRNISLNRCCFVKSQKIN